jgi:uncharacterized repeat protein (TIGR01451 family)
VLLLVALLPASAFADRPFQERFDQVAQGDITRTANALLTCQSSVPACADARRGVGSVLDNNDLPMTWVDVDNDPSTFDSSRGNLVLPADARVLFAGLYYGGRSQAGTGGQPAPNPGARDTVLFATPTNTDYLTLHANAVDDALDNQGQPRLYQGFVDVTDIVRAAGAGTYTVANVQLGTGQNADQSGGWALAIAYTAPSEPTRALTIFDGFRFVTAGGNPIDIPLSGFETPPSGPVRTHLGLLAFEGDLGITGDSATLNNQQLSDAANPATNFFNSSISDFGTPFTGRDPAYLNQMGVDSDTFDATGFLANAQTSTTIHLSTTGDGYAPGEVSFATDLFAPSLEPTKTVSESVARPGDELTYTVAVRNTGLDAATNTTLTDPLPAGTSFVPGSLAVTAGANTGTKTDAPGDDEAEFDPAGQAVVFRLGDGANATQGGRLAIDATTTVQFHVRVNTQGLAQGAVLTNRGTIGFTAETLGSTSQVDTPPADTSVVFPDLAITKTHTGKFGAGKRVTFHLAVQNVGQAGTRGTVTVTDELDPSLSFAGPAAGDGWACAEADRTLTCTRDDELAPGDPYPTIDMPVRIAAHAPPGQLNNTAVVAGGGDGNELNNSSTDGADVTFPDLAIDKSADQPRVYAGQRVSFTIRVQNIGESRATRVHLRDLLPAGLTLLSLDADQGTCDRLECHLGRIGPGHTVTLHLVALADSDTGGQRLVNGVRVSGRERELNFDNNADHAAVHVLGLADIVVSKSAASATATAGGDVAFVASVLNAGPSDATGVRFTDTLPPGLTLLSAQPSQGSCQGLTCELGNLRAGGSAQVLILARTDASLAGQTVANAAAADATEPDPNPANNRDTATVTLTAPPVPAPANVRVVKTASPRIVALGGVVTYTAVVTNHGPGTAPHVLFTDTPNGPVDVLAADPSQGRCTTALPIVCGLGSLAPGARATVRLRLRPLAPGRLENGATAITPSTGDGDGAGVAVVAHANVRLTKHASRRTLHGGQRVTFTLRLRSVGRVAAHAVRVCDRLPNALAYARLGGARMRHGAACWTVRRLAAGRTRVFRLVARAMPVSRRTRATNRARVAGVNLRSRTARATVHILPKPRRRATFTG